MSDLAKPLDTMPTDTSSSQKGAASSGIGKDALRSSAAPSGKGTNDGNGGVITVQPLRRSEMQPSYKQDLGLDDIDHGCYGTMMNCIGATAGFFGQLPFCFCCPNPFKEVKQGSVGIVSRFGKAYRAEDPGLVHINPCSESLRRVDVKIQLAPIPHQHCMTRDMVQISVDSIVTWHVNNPYRAAYGIADVRAALVERAQTTLRHVIGSRNLQSVISDREQVAAEIGEIVESVAEKWGVQVESILIKDIIFSKELQESLSSAATERRKAEARIIGAKAEVESAKLMRQAADILASPAAMQIRQLEALQSMAKSADSKVVFVPMNLDGPGAQALINGSGQQPVSSAGPSNTLRPNAGLSVQDTATINQLTQM